MLFMQNTAISSLWIFYSDAVFASGDDLGTGMKREQGWYASLHRGARPQPPLTPTLTPALILSISITLFLSNPNPHPHPHPIPNRHPIPRSPSSQPPTL